MSSLFANTIEPTNVERSPRVFAHRSSIRRRAITDAHAQFWGVRASRQESAEVVALGF